MRTTFVFAPGAALALLSPLALSQTAAHDGYRVTGTTSHTPLCGDSPAFATLEDGRYVVFDGYDVELRTAHGALLQRLATFPHYRFPSFVRVLEATRTAYVGESSTGEIFAVDIDAGGAIPVATLAFNFDMEFDASAGLAYVSAATRGFGTNSVHRLDLFNGQTTEVVQLTGFSGPVTVDGAGDLLVGDITDVFPFPPNSAAILRFADADLDGGAVLTEADAAASLPGFDGLSSLAYDHDSSQLFAMETNTGAVAQGSALARLSDGLVRHEDVAWSTSFAGGLELFPGNVATGFGPYQPDHASLSFRVNDCFGSTGLQTFTVRPARPLGSFTGPTQGNSGPASFDVAGGPPNGAAALWIARSGALDPTDVLVNLGGAFPIALRADVVDFGRRFTMVPLDANGDGTFPFFQDVAIEGAVLAQWLVHDASGALVTSSTFAINRSPF